jgi:YafQ family addiction module toxin component
MYKIKVRESTEKILKKLTKKDKTSAQYISKKIKEISENPYHFKPLRKPLQNFWRVHIGNYVLIYSIDEKSKTVTIEKYEHHDKAYKI